MWTIWHDEVGAIRLGRPCDRRFVSGQSLLNGCGQAGPPDPVADIRGGYVAASSSCPPVSVREGVEDRNRLGGNGELKRGWLASPKPKDQPSAQDEPGKSRL